jgi:cation transport ATPase
MLIQTIVAEARTRQLTLAIPSTVVETPGEGVEGVVEGRHLTVGGIQFVMSKLPQGTENPHQPERVAGAVIVAVAIDGRLAGEIRLADELRSGTQSLLQRLRMLGVQPIELLACDRDACRFGAVLSG